ncbi:MAG TPA: YhbY family RNA-binding protein [Candidatus Thermoplasmatota archaeon]|nr:YhbY family RNA-binding protein [Candidatus Thermoplasmatota archaeon]
MVELSSKDIAALKAEAQSLDVGMHVGKAGITDTLISELDDQLTRHRVVKVRLLKSAREETGRHDLADELAERTGAILVEVRGNTAVFYRPRGMRRPKPAAEE